MGGAGSHDKDSCKLNISWWVRELPKKGIDLRSYKNVNKHHCKFDYIFTHCASYRVQKHYGQTNELTDYFVGLENTDFQHWHFGHYHEDRYFGECFTFLYQRVVKRRQ